MDAPVIDQLELFDPKDCCLFSYIDYTRTKFGRRLLRRWLMQPMLSPKKINERLDIIEDLRDKIPRIQLERFRQKLSSLPDLERKISRLFTYSVADKTPRIVNYTENVYHARLRELKAILDTLRDIDDIVAPLRACYDKFSSVRLRQLLRRQGEVEQNRDGSFPDTRATAMQLQGLLDWKTVVCMGYEKWFKHSET